MKLIRFIIGRFILLFDWLFPPKKLERTPEKLKEIQAKSQGLSLYHLQTCPFCVKVRRHMKTLGVQLETRDVGANDNFRQELESQGGMFQVPCLRIEENGQVRWMYESSDINEYLTQRFS